MVLKSSQNGWTNPHGLNQRTDRTVWQNNVLFADPVDESRCLEGAGVWRRTRVLESRGFPLNMWKVRRHVLSSTLMIFPSKDPHESIHLFQENGSTSRTMPSDLFSRSQWRVGHETALMSGHLQTPEEVTEKVLVHLNSQTSPLRC